MILKISIGTVIALLTWKELKKHITNKDYNTITTGVRDVINDVKK